MKQNNKTYFQTWSHFLYFLCLLFIFTFWPVRSYANQDKLKIFTVNYPLLYFAERIASPHATVIFPAPAGVDPAYWMPVRGTIADYQQADLILLNGANYAKWVDKVSLPHAKMVDTSRKFKDQYIYSTETTTHSHGPEGAHAHESLAFTTWLDLQQAIQQAAAVKDALIKVLPDKAGLFDKNFTTLQKELLSLDQRLRSIGDHLQHAPLLFSHPVYQYLQRRYGFSGHALQWEPDIMPDEAQWQELKQVNGELKAQWMIWEDQPLTDITRRLEALNIHSVVFNPASNRSENEKQDFIAVMNANVANLSAIGRSHLEAGKQTLR